MKTLKVEVMWRLKSQWSALPEHDKKWTRLCVLEIAARSDPSGTSKMVVQALNETEKQFEFKAV